ncbi:hypothetical protein T261_02345 [Streptomyces lydicus]|nr:hypothetical protein T261_02345 [Streptomyces lydicus]
MVVIKVQTISVGMLHWANSALVPLILEEEIHVQERSLILAGSGHNPLAELADTSGQATSPCVGSEVG